MISVLKKEVTTLSNKARFIKMVIEDELIIKKKKRVILVNELYDLKFNTKTMLNNKKSARMNNYILAHYMPAYGTAG